MKIENLKNKKIAILWYWREGKSTLKFLLRLWIKPWNITILDKSKIDVDNISSIFWDDYLKDLEEYDLVFKSPWISPYNLEELQKVKQKLISQAEILADNFEWKIIWITWTKWKSTTSTLTYLALKELWYKVKLVWNIWNPVFDEIDLLSNEKYDFIIYELSSFMLEWLDLKIYIWLLNNIYDCHLDWHKGRDNYQNAKFNIFNNAKYKLIWSELESIIENKDNKIFFGLTWKYYYKNKAFYINDKLVFEDKNIALFWEHNKKNISWVLAILDIINPDFDINKFKKVLKDFSWLEHRQENIWIYKWITFINDSIASTPESAIAAIKTFWDKIWTIFIWNEDSWFDLEELKNTIKKYKIKNIVLFPVTWEKLFWDFSKDMSFDKKYKYVEDEFETNLYKTKSMEKAVKFAYNNTNVWEFVILSTWAPSFNAKWVWIMPWKSYIEKWNLFKKYVEKYWK